MTLLVRRTMWVAASMLLAPGVLGCTGAGNANASESEGGTDSGSCSPEPESCDQGTSPEMNPVDLADQCILPVAQVPGICVTSVNRCFPSAGLAIQAACAFAPDGGVFIGGPFASDNNVPTAPGWHFTIDPIAFPTPYPADEVATQAQQAECSTLNCYPVCGKTAPYGGSRCFSDGGVLDARSVGDAPDAARD